MLHLGSLYSIEVILTMILTLKVPALCYFFLWNPFVRTKFSVIDQCKYKETNTMQFWNYMYVYICVCFDFTSILVRKNNLYVPNRKTTKFGNNSLQVLGPHIWNLLPKDIKDMTSINKFKEFIKHWEGPKCKCYLV